MQYVSAMLGEILRREREAAGLSQDTVATRAGINRSYLSLLEHDVKSPTVNVLLRVCAAMGASAGKILSEVEATPRKGKKK
jgi:transcriptional regulator with XRE-family HTH domain